MTAFDTILERTECMLRDWFCRKDGGAALTAFDRDLCSWIGMDDVGSASSYAALEHLFIVDRVKVRPRSLSDLQLTVSVQEENYCVVTGSFRLQVIESGEEDCCRVTLVYAQRGGEPKIVHGHISAARLPAGVNGGPQAISSTEYERLHQAFEQKAAQVEMIARTTAGGMKGSLDDEKYTYFYVNKELCEMLGYTYDEFMEMSGGTAVGAVYLPDRAAALRTVAQCFAAGPEYHVEYRIRKKDGSLLWVLDSGRKIKNAAGRTVINSILTDISGLKQAVEQLRIERERYEIVAALAGETIFEYDFASDILQEFLPAGPGGQPQPRTIHDPTSETGAELLGIYPEDRHDLWVNFRALAKAPPSDQLLKLECRCLGEDGQYGWRRILVRFIYDAEGRLLKAVGKLTDISSERMLLQKSRVDALTGAYNRAYLEQAIARYLAQKPAEVFGACLMIDIDHFKILNDTCGHLCGDMVLSDLVRILKRLYRATDLIGRLGGDEFMVFMKDVYSDDIVGEKTERLLQMVRQYAAEAEISFCVTLSIGVSTTRDGAASFEQLYREADIALYNAKEGGRDRCVNYLPGMQYPAGNAPH